MTYYGTRFGCRWGQPHDMVELKDTQKYKVEVCKLCNQRFYWAKGFKGRINNPEYLKAHLRQYAQDLGPTRRVFNKLYHPEKTIIFI